MRLSLNLNPRKIAIVLGLIAVLLALQSIYADHLLFNVLGKNSDTTLARLLELSASTLTKACRSGEGLSSSSSLRQAFWPGSR